ncbi:Bromodomain-containing protein [Astrocystis sublimbata]|nr:Bromodomain-containing protein [Astrocystis sublimbata]
MDSKRKASGTTMDTAAADNDRAAKRRKLIEEYGDLANGETSETTTAYGLSILESIRATTDKNGRSVSPYFEALPSRSANPQYYKKIRLPLSLEVIERKLKEQRYSTLSFLESDFKRLVSNAKETNERNSTIFGDAERVRKAVSNLMVKHNPAYKSGNYQAVPTPLPPTPEPEGEDDEGEDHGETDEDRTAQTTKKAASEAPSEDFGDDAEVENGDEHDDDDEEAELNNGHDGDDPEEDGSKGSKRRRRRGSSRKTDSRPARNSTTPVQRSSARSGKADYRYENKPFKGLTFQQAQEKVVEELIRRKDDPDEYPYFEPFIFLPPRTLKDYYEVIAEPLSLKGLQKQIRGQHGRLEATWVSDFKGWAAFEDQASLIWKNAYHYNEDGSEIFSMAQELEESFQELLKEAKENVPEPTQPKIKLKMPPAAEPSRPPKKITIHVGGKSSLTGSPAPATAQSGDSDTTRNGTPITRIPFNSANSAGTPVNISQLEKARSVSASVGPPSPSMAGATKGEAAIQTTAIAQPQATPTPTPTTFQRFVPVIMNTHGPVPTPTPNGVTPQIQHPLPQAPPPPPPPPKKSATDILEAQKYRPQPIRETDALMPKLVIMTHPSLQVDSRFAMSFLASGTDYQQELAVNAPSNHFRLQLKPQVASFLEPEHREWKLHVSHDATRIYPSPVTFDKRGEPAFDVTLRFGVNRVEVSLLAALPKGERAPNGLNMEMERFVIHFNVLKH